MRETTWIRVYGFNETKEYNEVHLESLTFNRLSTPMNNEFHLNSSIQSIRRGPGGDTGWTTWDGDGAIEVLRSANNGWRGALKQATEVY